MKHTLLDVSLHNCGWKGRKIVCDTESTGFAPNDLYGKLLQISAISMPDGTTYDTYVDPELPFLKPRKAHPEERRRGKIPKKIRDLTGITDEMVKGAPGSVEASSRFREYIGDRSVVIYHNAPHDVMFLHWFASKVGWDFMSVPVIDTCVLAKYLWPDLPKKGGYKLSSLAEHLGISDEAHHTAINDAKVTAELFKIEMKQLETRGEISKIENFRDLYPYKDTLQAIRIDRVDTWTGRDGIQKRIYVRVSMGDADRGREHANVYYDFCKKEWGQKKSAGDFTVYNYGPVQQQITSMLALQDWNWGAVVTALTAVHPLE